MNKQDFSSAIESLSMAIQEDSLNSLFFKNRAYCYFYDDQYEKSEKDFLQCLSLGDEKPEYFYYLGLARSKMKDNEAAIDYYGRAIDLDPQDHNYYYHRGVCYMKIGSFEDAVKDFHLSVRLNPQHASSYFHRGQSYHMLRNNRAACVDWNIARKLDPKLSASQYEGFCSGEESFVWHDVKSLTEQESLSEPAFSDKSFYEFQRYIGVNIDFPVDLIQRNSIDYAAYGVTVLSDGSIGDIEKVISGTDLMDRTLKKAILDIDVQWEGGTVNGIPSDFLCVASASFFTSKYFNESEKLKKMIEEASAEGDNAAALKYCNEMLDLHPYNIFILRKRLVLNSRLGNEAAAAADKELFKKLNEVKFRYRPDKIFDKEGELLPVQKDSVTVFYNSEWHITSRDRAVYFRNGIWSHSKNFFTGTVCDYLLKDSSMISTVTYTPELKKTGEYISWSPNGKKLAEGSFKKNKMEGQWKFYDENGSLHYVVNFSGNQFEFESLIDDQNNDVIQTDEQDFELILNDIFVLSGTFENGKRAKTWKLDVNGNTLLREVFRDGEFVRGLYLKNGERVPLPSSELESVIFKPVRLEITESLFFDDRELFSVYEFINTDVVK